MTIHQIMIILSLEVIALGWPAFAEVEWQLLWDHEAGVELDWRRVEDIAFLRLTDQMAATFQVTLA